MRALIVNGYSVRNLGDGAIVQLMIEQFQAAGAAVTVMTDDPADVGRYGVPVIQSPLDTWNPHHRGVRGALVELRDALWQQIWRRSEIMEAADLMVSAGGGYLYDDVSRASRRNLLRRLHTLYLAIRVGKPVVLFSQSVGQFASGALARLTGKALRRCALVIVRDQQSLRLCEKQGTKRVESMP